MRCSTFKIVYLNNLTWRSKAILSLSTVNILLRVCRNYASILYVLKDRKLQLHAKLQLFPAFKVSRKVKSLQISVILFYNGMRKLQLMAHDLMIITKCYSWSFFAQWLQSCRQPQNPQQYNIWHSFFTSVSIASHGYLSHNYVSWG